MKASRRAAIMQPYFFPYIGYFQLISAVDRFVIYDTVKYTKKGWINRNRILSNGAPAVFTLPLESASDFLDIGERRIAQAFQPSKLCAQIAQAYRRAPYFRETIALVESVLYFEDANLFRYLQNALIRCCRYLNIETPITVASEIEGESRLQRQDRVLDICERLEAGTYINPIGGTELYDPTEFDRRGIALRFLRTRPFVYTQFEHSFVPSLSILDLLMFNSRSTLTRLLQDGYDLVEKEDISCPVGASSDVFSIPEACADARG